MAAENSACSRMDRPGGGCEEQGEDDDQGDEDGVVHGILFTPAGLRARGSECFLLCQCGAVEDTYLGRARYGAG